MGVNVIIPERLYRSLAKHLFKGSLEQGAFLFATDSSISGEPALEVKNLYLIPSEAWDVHSPYYLELKDTEKVRIMKMARQLDCHLIECHSHRHSSGPARFSPSDISGLDEFVEYVRWKLPGKKYGALVWTESSVYGQVWNGGQASPTDVSEVRIAKRWGRYTTVNVHQKPPISILRRITNAIKGIKR
jgi:hypothetical protein